MRSLHGQNTSSDLLMLKETLERGSHLILHCMHRRLTRIAKRDIPTEEVQVSSLKKGGKSTESLSFSS